MKHLFYTADHPEADGRTPQAGEVGYELKFPLVGGDELRVRCGDLTLQYFSQMIGSLLIDNESERT